MTRRAWSKQWRRHVLTRLGQVLFALVRRLRFARAAGLAEAAALLAPWVLARPTRQAHEHLARARGCPRAARRRIVRGMYRNLCWSAVEFCLLDRDLDRWLAQGRITYDLGPIRRAGLERRALVLITGHLGNWEALAAIIGRLVPLAVVARRVYLDELDRLQIAQRRRLGLATFYADDSPRALLAHLKRGGTVGLLPDQDLKRMPGIFVRFFHAPARTVTGPANLARLVRAPLVPVFCRRRRGMRLHCFAGRPLAADPQLPRDEAVRRLTEEWSRQLEAVIARRPEDWAWFHRRWRSRPGAGD